ncbi:MAG: biotin synthase BioB [Pseudomonadota bacterium]
MPSLEPRSDWSREEIAALFDKPFMDLVFEAQLVHRAAFDPNAIQLSTLLSIKTGGCPEDCSYCSQSAKFDTGLKASKLMEVQRVVAEARRAKEGGASRYCMGAAWRNPKDRDMDKLCTMVREVKGLGLETCMTLGMLTTDQAEQLADAGLDYYNHNIDTSPEFYDKVITTRTFDDRLETLDRVRAAGMNVCCGGILGLGESREDRVGFLHSLATLSHHPESVPINMLVRVPGTPLGETASVEPLEFVRTIAVARLVMPRSMVRLSAGREEMSDEVQALAFLAGANSIFLGEQLLTTKNPETDKDRKLFDALGLKPMVVAESPETPERANTPDSEAKSARGSCAGASCQCQSTTATAPVCDVVPA